MSTDDRKPRVGCTNSACEFARECAQYVPHDARDGKTNISKLTMADVLCCKNPNFGIGRAIRANEGKLPYNLIPPEFMEGLAMVLAYGARKYAARNFEKGLDTEDLIRGAFSHMVELQKGELLDTESGLSHAAHAAWNMLALYMQFSRSEKLKVAHIEQTLARKTTLDKFGATQVGA